MKQFDGHSPRCRQWYDLTIICFEMLCPLVMSRMKQGDHRTCVWIKGRQIAAFVLVAQRAGQRQIVWLSQAAMLQCNDVIYFMWHQDNIVRNQTVLAATYSAFDDQLSQGC